MPPLEGILDNRQPGVRKSRQPRGLLWIGAKQCMNEIGRLPCAWAGYDDAAPAKSWVVPYHAARGGVV